MTDGGFEVWMEEMKRELNTCVCGKRMESIIVVCFPIPHKSQESNPYPFPFLSTNQASPKFIMSLIVNYQFIDQSEVHNVPELQHIFLRSCYDYIKFCTVLAPDCLKSHF